MLPFLLELELERMPEAEATQLDHLTHTHLEVYPLSSPAVQVLQLHPQARYILHLWEVLMTDLVQILESDLIQLQVALLL